MKVAGSAALLGIEERIGYDAISSLREYYPPSWERVNELSKRLISNLKGQNGFFFFTHYFDVHLPGWWPPALFDTGPSWAIGHYKKSVAKSRKGLLDAFEFADRERLWEDTIIIVTADHGENLYEKGHYAHAYTMSEELLRVPLYVHIPGEKFRIDTRLVSTLDIAATIDDLFSIGADGLEGMSLLSSSKESSRWIFTMPVGSQKFSVVHGQYKYIWDRECLTHELYNVVEDPGEIFNLVEAKKNKAEEMSRSLASFVSERA
jgi:hypothetical protein